MTHHHIPNVSPAQECELAATRLIKAVRKIREAVHEPAQWYGAGEMAVILEDEDHGTRDTHADAALISMLSPDIALAMAEALEECASVTWPAPGSPHLKLARLINEWSP